MSLKINFKYFFHNGFYCVGLVHTWEQLHILFTLGLGAQATLVTIKNVGLCQHWVYIIVF
jgi:hypothetical protein